LQNARFYEMVIKLFFLTIPIQFSFESM
jgi:hypothetical protein